MTVEIVYQELNPRRSCGCKMDFNPKHLRRRHRLGPDNRFIPLPLKPGCIQDDHGDYSMTEYGAPQPPCDCACHKTDPVVDEQGNVLKDQCPDNLCIDQTCTLGHPDH